MKRVIKYAALIFALMLAASIIGGCLTAGVAVVQMLVDKTENSAENTRNNGEDNDIWYRDDDGDVVFLGIHFGNSGAVKSGSETFDSSEFDALYMEVGSGELIVEVWDKDVVFVEYENIPEDYEIYNDDGTLTIEMEGSIFTWGVWLTETPKIHVSVPADKVFEQVEVEKGSGSAKVIGLQADILKLENGSGGVGISNVTTEELYVDSGSGGVNISDVAAEKSGFNSGSGSFVVQNSNTGDTSMDSGSGFVNFENIIAKNLVLDTGSGRVDVSGYLTGNCVFESGSGSLNVVIYGEEEDYNIRTDMGSGSFYLNGDKEKDTHIEHNGAKHLLIFEAGSGRVSVEFKTGAYTNSGNEANSADSENYDR